MISPIETSVVICAYTMLRWKDICEAVASVRSCEGPRPEIVLVIDHNAELLAKALSTFKDAVVISNGFTPGLSGARNAGIKVSKGRFIGFLDDDAVAHPAWLNMSVQHFADPTIIGVMPRILPQWLSPQPRWFPDEFLWAIGASHPNAPDKPSVVRNLFGGGMLIRREAFETAGGFDTAFGRTAQSLPISCEETEWCLRARRALPNANFIIDPGATIEHKVHAGRLTWSYLLKRTLAEGVSKARLVRVAGVSASLSEERRYVAALLGQAVGRDLGDVFVRGDIWGLARIAASLLALGSATVGYMAGLVMPFPIAAGAARFDAIRPVVTRDQPIQ